MVRKLYAWECRRQVALKMEMGGGRRDGIVRSEGSAMTVDGKSVPVQEMETAQTHKTQRQLLSCQTEIGAGHVT